MNEKTKKLVGMGLLTAIVIILQAMALSIRFGVFTVTLVLAPIVVGAAMYGYLAGAWLGFVFGVIVLLTDAGAFLAINVPGTIITCLLKGVAAGLCAGLVYNLLEKKNSLIAVIGAGVVAPIANTGIFLIGCSVFFLGTIREWGAAAGFDNAWAYMITAFVGLNFIVELLVNLILSSAIVRIIKYANKTK